MRLLHLFFVLITIAAISGFSQGFGFQNLLFSSEGVQLKSRELPLFEKLDINLVGIHGYDPVDGAASLGMEVRLSDENDKELMYSADMFANQPIPLENVPYLDFNFGLGADFEVGKTYFLKVRLWDKNTKKEMEKETSLKVLPPLRNRNVEIEEKGFKSLDIKIYKNKSRYYNGNIVREGDEVYVDMYFEELELDKKVSADYQIGLQNMKTGEVIPIEQDVMVISDPTQLSNINYSMVLEGNNLKYGSIYRLVINLKIDALDSYFYMGYAFEYVKKGSEANTEVVPHKEYKVYINKEENNDTKRTLFPSDRIDIAIRNLNTLLKNENMTNSIGGELIIFDNRGKELNRSGDLFEGNQVVGSDVTSEITMNWMSTWDIAQNEIYTLKAVIWDKYSFKRFEYDIVFRGGKFKKKPYGLDKNSAIVFSHDANKIDPVATYVIRNGYNYYGNELNPGDEVFLKVSGIKKSGVDASNFESVVQIKDEQGVIITESSEDASKFEEGEFFSTISIPYSGEEIGKSFILVSKLMDGNKTVIGAEYKFKVVK